MSRVVGVAFVTVAFVFVAFAGVMGMITPIHAQAVYNWTGLYAGGTIGGGRFDNDAAVTTTCPANGYFCNGAKGAANAGAIGTAGTTSYGGGTFTADGHLGYDYQYTYVVLGIEAGAGALTFHGSNQSSSTYPAAGPAVAAGKTNQITASFSTDWMATVRGRIGWAGLPGVLFYADGGLAMTNLNVSNAFTDSAGAFENAPSASVQTGWTAGGGAQVALTRNWVTRLEYMYVDFGSAAVSGTVARLASPGLTNGLTTTQSLTAHIVRLGIDYRF